MKFNTMKETVQFRINEDEENYSVEEYWNEALKCRLARISRENYDSV